VLNPNRPHEGQGSSRLKIRACIFHLQRGTIRLQGIRRIRVIKANLRNCTKLHCRVFCLLSLRYLRLIAASFWKATRKFSILLSKTATFLAGRNVLQGSALSGAASSRKTGSCGIGRKFCRFQSICGKILRPLGNGLERFSRGQTRRCCGSPPGFAHGFLVLSDEAHVLTKSTEFDCPELERTIAWNDPHLDIEWALQDTRLFPTKRNVVWLCDKPRCSTSGQSQ
jgi:hypothetical protein